MQAAASSRSVPDRMEEAVMVFKPNYNQQRAERDRAKQAKKEAKAREREDALALRRKAEQDGSAAMPESEDARES